MGVQSSWNTTVLTPSSAARSSVAERVAVRKGAVAEPPLFRDRQDRTDAQLRRVPDPPLVKILRPGLHRRRLKAKREGHRQPQRRVQQPKAQQHFVFPRHDLDGAVRRLRLPALVRFGKPTQPAVLPAEPHERLERQRQPRLGQRPAVHRTAPTPWKVVEQARPLTPERHFQPELLQLGRRLVLRQHHQIHSHQPVEFHSRGGVDDQLVARLPAGHDRLRRVGAEHQVPATLPLDRLAVDAAHEANRRGQHLHPRRGQRRGQAPPGRRCASGPRRPPRRSRRPPSPSRASMARSAPEPRPPTHLEPTP